MQNISRAVGRRERFLLAILFVCLFAAQKSDFTGRGRNILITMLHGYQRTTPCFSLPVRTPTSVPWIGIAWPTCRSFALRFCRFYVTRRPNVSLFARKHCPGSPATTSSYPKINSWKKPLPVQWCVSRTFLSQVMCRAGCALHCCRNIHTVLQIACVWVCPICFVCICYSRNMLVAWKSAEVLLITIDSNCGIVLSGVNSKI